MGDVLVSPFINHFIGFNSLDFLIAYFDLGSDSFELPFFYGSVLLSHNTPLSMRVRFIRKAILSLNLYRLWTGILSNSFLGHISNDPLIVKYLKAFIRIFFLFRLILRPNLDQQ